jgi:putative spermidine/putrescine transport system permease protein
MMLDGFPTTPWSKLLGKCFAFAVVLFLAAPTLIVVPMSFAPNEFLEFPPHSLSLRWYENFMQSVAWRDAARVSLIVASLTTLIALPLGVLAAYGILQLRRRARVLISLIIALPAVIPTILIAVGLFFILARLGWIGSIPGLVMGHVALAIPVVFVVMSSAFRQFDFSQEQAARSLGARPWQIWFQVILPQVITPLYASSLLAFVTSLDEVVVATFVTSGDNATLPKVMFTALRDEVDPTIAAVSTMLLLVASLAVFAISRRGVSALRT